MDHVHRTLIDAVIHLHDKNYHTLDLSTESELDIDLLRTILEKTCYLQKLILPKLENAVAENILSMIVEQTIYNTTLTHLEVDFSTFTSKALTLLQKINLRLQRNQKKIFAIHGGGNIGLGLMADIISQSKFKYQIVATSSNTFMNTLINSTGQYWLQHDHSSNAISCVNNVTMIYSRNQQNIIELYKRANVAALCLTEDGVINAAPQIAKALIERYQFDGAGLQILVLMNKPNADRFVRNEVMRAIQSEIQDPLASEKILQHINFIPTMVDRIVSKHSRKHILNQIKDQLTAYDTTTLTKLVPEKKSIQIEDILTNTALLTTAINTFNLRFNLFHTEHRFSLYVPTHFRLAPHFPHITSVKDITRFITIKNKYFNGPHAIIAWLGGLKGYTTISDTISNPAIKDYIIATMQQEIAPILQAEYPEVSEQEWLALRQSFISRCSTNREDTIVRVGRDPLRKLNKGGCIRGVLDLRERHKLRLATPKLEYGMAAGIVYAIKQIDPTNPECKKILDIYRKSGSYQAVLCYKGPYGNGHYPGLDPVKDGLLIRNILKRILAILSNTKRAA